MVLVDCRALQRRENTLARLFVIFGGFVVLVLTAALVGPYFVDWTSYRGDFEREASRILGREVKVAGDASARILPFPSLTFTDVRVAGTDGEPALTAEEFSMDAELAPFLRGELLIFDMRLVRPKAVIRIGNDGAVDWAVRPKTPFDPSHVTIENLTVTEGAVRIEHAASGRTHQLTEINTGMTATTLAGPWRIIGSMRLDGALTDFDLSTGRVEETGAMRVRVRAKPQRYPFSVETDGTARLDGGAPKYEAGFKLSAYDEEPALRGTDGATFALNDPADASKGPPDYRMSGKLEFDHRRLAASEFVFETGPLEDPYTAEGRADLDLGGEPRFSIEATGAQFRFDDRVGDDARGSLTLEKRIAAIKSFVAALPKPSIPGSVEVNLPAVVAGDTTFRDVRLSAEPAQGGWTLKDFAVSMPGRTTLEADGFVATTEEDASFSGNMLLAVGQPSGFASWLSRDVDDAIRRLPRAGFSAKVDLASGRQVFDDLKLQLGEARFAGRLDSVTPEDAKPSLLLSLDGGELDVEGLAAFASLFVTDAGQARVEGRDLDLKVSAGPVSAGGLTAGRLETALRLKDGRLDIDKLTLTDVSGANLSATGAIDGFPAQPSGNLDAAIVADDLGPLAAVLGERYPDNRVAAALARRLSGLSELGRDARINLVATATQANGEPHYALSAGGTMGGGEFTLAYSATGSPFAPDRIDVDLTAENKDGAALLALYGLPTLPLVDAGPAATELTLKGAPDKGLETHGKLTGDTATAAFDGTVTVLPETVTAQGRARIEGADLEPWLGAAGVTLPGMGLGIPAELAADLTLSPEHLKIGNLDGSIGEVALSGDLTATIANGVPHLAGNMATDFLPLDSALALVLGEGTLQGDGAAWASTAFPPRVSAPFTADLGLKAGAVGWGVETVATDASMLARLTNEGLAVSNLSAGIDDGRLSGLFEVKNNDGTGVLTGQATLSGVDVSQLPGAGALSGKANLSADFSTSGKSVEAMAASLSGTGTAAVSEVKVRGINPAAMPALIAEADRIGRDIKEETVAAFAPAIAGEGEFAGGDADLSFTIAGGVLRSSPLTLTSQGATMTAELRADLPEWQIAASGEITYDPGNEALVGSQPSLNFGLEGAPGEAALVFDAQPMAQFLTQRALEIEQARVEAMQAALLEKQRLRREVRYYAMLQQARAEAEAERLRLEEEARQKAEEEARLQAEAEAKARAEEEERLRAEEEAKRKAAEEAKAKADAEAKARAEEQARAKAESDAKARAAEEEAARAKAEEERRLKLEEAARLKAAQDAQAAAEAAAREKAATAQGEAAAPQGAAEPLVDMAGRPPQGGEVRRPQAPVGAEPKPAQPDGFSLERLFRSLGGGG